MFKTGIYSLENLISGRSLKTLFGDDKDISITLYDKIQGLDNADNLAEKILLLFKDDRGVYKRTYAKRFEEFDLKLLEYFKNYLKPKFDLNNNLVIFDVGVSDARTSLDLFEKLTVKFKNIKYIASDYNNLVYIINKNQTNITVDPNGKILEILWPPFVFNKIRLNRFLFLYPLNHIIKFFVYILIALPLVKAYKNGKLSGKKLVLFDPYALDKALGDPRFVLKQHNLLQPFNEAQPANFIRAMNVLNPSYFSGHQLKIIIKNLYFGLKEDGLLVVGSNQDADSLVDGAIYKKTNYGFKLLEKFGKGFINSSLIEDFGKRIF